MAPSACNDGRTLLLRALSRPPRTLSLSSLPTPVERAPWLDTDRREAWIKRDDRSAAIYGGGKVRKLEWTLANPPFAHAATITSTGGIGSNHLVALALYLRHLDRRLRAIVFPQPITPTVRDNLAVMASLGTQWIFVRGRWQLPAAWARWHRPWRRDRDRDPLMAPGGSTGLGGFGFVGAGLELAHQIRAGELPCPATVFIAGGTGGACSGLVLGLALGGIATHVHVVSTVERLLFNRTLMHLKLHSTYRCLLRHGLHGPDSVRRCLEQGLVTWSVDHSQLGAGYGAPTRATTEACIVAANHGVHLDHAYTAKCVAGVRRSHTAGPALFWHTHAATDLKPYIRDDWQSQLPDPLRAYLQQHESVGI